MILLPEYSHRMHAGFLRGRRPPLARPTVRVQAGRFQGLVSQPFRIPNRNIGDPALASSPRRAGITCFKCVEKRALLCNWLKRFTCLLRRVKQPVSFLSRFGFRTEASGIPRLRLHLVEQVLYVLRVLKNVRCCVTD